MMIISKTYKGKNIAVMGLGKSGIATVESLAKVGANIFAWDDNSENCSKLDKKNYNISNLEKIDFKNISSLVLSPGIPLNFPKPHPVVERAKSAGCEVIGDFELFFRSKINANVIGITGTNGKSTTTSLITHILKNKSINVQAGGNIGTPILSLDKIDSDGFYVLEISSYQLDLSSNISLDISVLLNIQPDHLDRHGSIENYYMIKKKIFESNKTSSIGVIGVDDFYSGKLYSEIKNINKSIIPISTKKKISGGVSVIDGIIYDTRFNYNIIDINNITNLRGRHNWQNAAAAYIVAKEVGLSNDETKSAFETFKGLPHRLELVYKDKKTEYINDSKATNVHATSYALSSFESIFWILGGRSKDKEIDPLFPYLNRVEHAFTIGESGEMFAQQLYGKVEVEFVTSLENAFHRSVDTIKKRKLNKSVILFSPACSSFDQFKDFEERGEKFRDIVIKYVGQYND
ncbi:MAG: UDP-N-acetylmuramoylalanine--D-glutamate ligase [Alphaproteobacteria bacterium MarineAlpha2_Bin1]|nr:MAG: UDP-N-acetylmuramoylalanine--D-glutamate ligase [Alphaproteobacteria bacterium MarineAlpha2_Bin1]|tara:strand:+ start:372 stop:1754 length:1383 start_codon:yes stop_codon:yes gene_type:complete